MKIEKKSKLDSVSLDNPDFLNLSFSKVLVSFIKTNYLKICEEREQFNPLPLWKKFKQDYRNKNFIENFRNLLTVINFSIIYSFFPGWFLKTLLETGFSTLFWQVTFKKTQILIHNHRLLIRTTVSKNSLDLKTILSIIPFALGFGVFLSKKSSIELNQYFFAKNLPGLSLPSEKLNWDTVQYFLKSTLQKDESREKNVQSFYHQNSLLLNTNIFEDDLRQKVFINKYKKDQHKAFELTSYFYFPAKEKNSLIFQNLDELPLYLESLFPKLESQEKNFSNYPLLNIQKLNFSKQTSESEFKPKLELFQPEKRSTSLKTADQILSKNQTTSKKVLNLKKPTFVLGLQTPQKKQVVFQQVKPNLQTLVKNNKFLTIQQEFQDLWQKFQIELRTLYVKQNFNFYQFSDETLASFLQEHESMAMTEIEEEEKILLQDFFSYINQKEILENPYQTRRMSGYRYPDMTNQELRRFFLPPKLTSYLGKFKAILKPGTFAKENFQILQTTFLEIKIPSLFVGNALYDFQVPAFPKFSILTKPLLLKDLETDKVLYEGPGLVLDSSSGFDWLTKIRNTDFQIEPRKTNSKNQISESVLENLLETDNINLRLWFHKHITPYPGFTTPTKNFFVGQRSEGPNQNKTQKQEWIESLPFYQVELRYDLGNMSQAERDALTKVFNSNESFFALNTHLTLPVMSAAEWQTSYQKIQEKIQKNKLSDKKDSKSIELACFPVPILQTRIPQFQEKHSYLPQVNSQLSLHDKIEYQMDPTLFNVAQSTPFSLNTQTNFESILEKETFETTFTSGTYKTVPTIFSSFSLPTWLNFIKQSFFIENWEPLSLQSWLIVSQIGFSFCVFQILKNLASNYGRELLGYLLELVAATGFVEADIQQQIEILMGKREKGFRIISKNSKKFSDVAGIETFLPQIGEVVWFLRNSARNFSLSQTLPRGILLVGPPGTGKTLLVQALAGEARVPVVALSGSSLVEPGESGALKLEMAFQEARELAPCIVFIDEIDTLAQKREKVMQQAMASEEMDDILEVLASPVISSSSQPNLNQFKISLSAETPTSEDQTPEPVDAFSPTTPSSLEIQVTQQIHSQQDLQKQQLTLLMQLLIELDGIKGRDGVIVIGATNRPEMLDAAVLRPGRFDRVLKVGLPSYEKRIEILKLYGQKLGYDESISWNYFAERTAGFAAADIASLMNQSSLKAIVNETYHTVETLEHGINRITTLESQGLQNTLSSTKRSTKIKDVFERLQKEKASQRQQKFFSQKQKIFENETKISGQTLFTSNRFAYYQAGKIICTSLLQTHPPILVAYLWPRRPNIRSVKIAQNLQNYFFKFARRHELEDRIIGCYAGKVGEILFLQKLAFSSLGGNSPDILGKTHQLFNVNLSTIGLEDLTFGQVLIKFLIENWYLYSYEALTHRMTELADNRNRQELSEEKIAFMNYLCETFESHPRPIGQFLPSPFTASKTKKDRRSGKSNRILTAQHYFSIPWWQRQISSEFDVAERDFLMWYRIFMSNPQESELNPDWVPPDEFYHRNRIPEAVSSSKISSDPFLQIPNMTSQQQRFVMNWWEMEQSTDCSWNDLGNISQEYQTHSLVLQSFNKALLLVDQHRELLDVIASKLLSQKILRQWDIVAIFENYQVDSSQLNFILSKNSQATPKDTDYTIKFPTLTSNQKIVVNSDWGKSSNKKTANWIDFGLFLKK